MNQITTRYVTENGACYEQYVITDAEAKTEPDHHPGARRHDHRLHPERRRSTSGPAIPTSPECNRPRFGVPVLFPNCGNCRITACTSLTARHTPWRTTALPTCAHGTWKSVGPDGVTTDFESTPLTKFLYPFDFTLLVNYNLEGNNATISMTVINEGDTDMPFSFGYHPYFMASKLWRMWTSTSSAPPAPRAPRASSPPPREDHPHPQGRC
ncbi:MAG: hypothetical protein ACLVJH_18275 [Faecalibacterium prausnitzii]